MKSNSIFDYLFYNKSTIMIQKLFLIGLIASVYAKPYPKTAGVVYIINVVPKDVVHNSVELMPSGDDFQKSFRQSAIDELLKHVLLGNISDDNDETSVLKYEGQDFDHLKVLRQSAVDEILKRILLGNDEILDSTDEGKKVNVKKSNFLTRMKRAAENFQNDPSGIVDLLGYAPLRDLPQIVSDLNLQGLSLFDVPTQQVNSWG